MFRSLLAASVLLLLPSPGEASMSDQTLLGQSFDPRITECGVRIEGGMLAVLRPFIQASSDLSGNVDITLEKRSRSGTSTIRQANGFSGRSLGNPSLAVNRPAQVDLTMTVRDREGRELCRLERQFELANGTV